jgi:hypothetical protein
MLSPMQAMCVLSGSILGLLGTTRYFSTKWERISLIFMVTVLRVVYFHIGRNCRTFQQFFAPGFSFLQLGYGQARCCDGF